VTGAKEGAPEDALHPERDGYGGPFGTAVHTLLEQCVRRRGASPSFSDAVLETILERAGAEADPQEIARARRMVSRFLESPIWTEVQTADPVYTEYPLVHHLSSTSVPSLKRGVIDLAYRTGDGWTLVDYKTDPVSSAEGEQIADDHPYVHQIHAYAKAWAAVLGEPAPRAGLWFADSGAHVVVVS
jgi:ATP-dependent helicase/nuclease subunit A